MKNAKPMNERGFLTNHQLTSVQTNNQIRVKKSLPSLTSNISASRQNFKNLVGNLLGKGSSLSSCKKISPLALKLREEFR